MTLWQRSTFSQVVQFGSSLKPGASSVSYWNSPLGSHRCLFRTTIARCAAAGSKGVHVAEASGAAVTAIKPNCFAVRVSARWPDRVFEFRLRRTERHNHRAAAGPSTKVIEQHFKGYGGPC